MAHRREEVGLGLCSLLGARTFFGIARRQLRQVLRLQLKLSPRPLEVDDGALELLFLALQFGHVGMDRDGPPVGRLALGDARMRSEEHTSELQSLMRISYAVFCLKKQKNKHR